MKERKKNHCTKIVKILSNVNAQTAILEVLNAFGVVIPLPKKMSEVLKNFTALMNPMMNWCGSTSVCLEEKGSPVYSNLTKFVQIVIWTCLHPSNQLEEKRLPFRFAEVEPSKLQDFFGTTRSKSQSWHKIVRVEACEEIVRPCFGVVGKQDPLSLYDLLQAVITDRSDDCNSESWKGWDELLASFPKKGLKSLLSTTISSTQTLAESAPHRAKYSKLAKEVGYPAADADAAADENIDATPQANDSADDAAPESNADADAAEVVGEVVGDDSQVVGDDNDDEANNTMRNKKGASKVNESVRVSSPPMEHCRALVASVPQRVWEDDYDRYVTNKLLLDSALDHLQKAVFILALAQAGRESESLPKKEDLEKSSEVAATSDKQGHHLHRNLNGLLSRTHRLASEPSPGDEPSSRVEIYLANGYHGLIETFKHDDDAGIKPSTAVTQESAPSPFAAEQAAVGGPTTDKSEAAVEAEETASVSHAGLKGSTTPTAHTSSAHMKPAQVHARKTANVANKQKAVASLAEDGAGSISSVQEPELPSPLSQATLTPTQNRKRWTLSDYEEDEEEEEEEEKEANNEPARKQGSPKVHEVDEDESEDQDQDKTVATTPLKRKTELPARTHRKQPRHKPPSKESSGPKTTPVKAMLPPQRKEGQESKQKKKIPKSSLHNDRPKEMSKSK
jgi:hypothetical protein